MKPITNSKAMSLVEVLIAVVIIAVALYGIVVSLGAQQIAEGHLRESKVLKQLHYQLVREYLRNQRDQDPTNILTTVKSFTLSNPALGQDTVYFGVTKIGGPAATPYTSTYNSQAYTKRNGQTMASSSITLFFPYDGSVIATEIWQNVKP